MCGRAAAAGTSPPASLPHPAEPFPLERIRFASRVAAVGQGWVELARPLPHDLRVGWQVGSAGC